jgi:hypothetical protein
MHAHSLAEINSETKWYELSTNHAVPKLKSLLCQTFSAHLGVKLLHPLRKAIYSVIYQEEGVSNVQPQTRVPVHPTAAQLLQAQQSQAVRGSRTCVRARTLKQPSAEPADERNQEAASQAIRRTTRTASKPRYNYTNSADNPPEPLPLPVW